MSSTVSLSAGDVVDIRMSNPTTGQMNLLYGDLNIAAISGSQGIQGATGLNGNDGSDGAQGVTGVAGLSFYWGGNWTASTYYPYNTVVAYGAYFLSQPTSVFVVTNIAGTSTSIPPPISGDFAPWAIATGFRGPWDQTVRYNPFDIVTFNKTTYICPNGVLPEPTPPPSSLSWNVFTGGLNYITGGWNSSVTYYPGDIVLDGGDPLLQTYICVVTNNNSEPYQNLYTLWDVISPAGSQGATGIQGQTGIQGLTGIQGNDGSQGVTGIQGATGYGVIGTNGVTGVQGVTGAGIQGVTGVQGLTGLFGVPTVYSQTGLSGAVATSLTNGNYFRYSLIGSTLLSNPTGTPNDGQLIQWEFIQGTPPAGITGFGSNFDFGTDLPSTGIQLSTGVTGISDLMAVRYNGLKQKYMVTGFIRGF